jgi:hypothetical protein
MNAQFLSIFQGEYFYATNFFEEEPFSLDKLSVRKKSEKNHKTL